MLLPFSKSVVKLFAIIFVVVGFLFSANEARAAITPAQVSAAGATAAATTRTVTTFTPAANTLYLLWAIQTIATGPAATPTVSCANGLTMVQENTVLFNTTTTQTHRITLFRGLRTTVGTNNTCTITWNQTVTGGGYSLVSFSGVDTSGTDGSGAVVQSITGVTDGATTAGLSISLASIIPGSTTAGGFSNARNTSNSLSAGTGYTAGTSWNFGAPNTSARAEWSTTTGSATVNMTQSHAVDIAGIAVEVRQPPTATLSSSPSTCTILSGASTCTVPFTWSISNAISPNLYNTTTTNTYSTSPSGTSVSFAITNGSNTVQARDSSTVLASTVVTASCTSGTSWNGSSCAVTPAVPTVTSPTVTAITSSGATLGANVTSLGIPASISERGTCWGTTAAPVTNCVAEGNTTTGIFTHARTGMSPSTLYYYRGYATNATGTGYSADGTFTTSAAGAVPTVSTPTVTSITTTGATLGATVDSLGVPASISARGTCWGTTPAPVTNCVAEGGTSTGVFTHARTGMSPSTLYYYRGYATNATGTGYSVDGTFTTSATPAVPTVTSPTVTSITASGATLGANVTSLGAPASISARGTCWGTSPSPVTNCVAEGGTTTGVFTHARTGMSSNTLYYYRGYATNATGTGYSADDTFTTSAITGSVSASPTTCTILSGVSTCDIPFTWSIFNATSPNLFNATTATTYSTSASGSSVSFPITNGDNTVQARDSSTVLASTLVTASCTSGTAWNGSTCAATPAVPTVTTPTATSITTSGATLGANVTSLGVPASISARGTCWGTSPAPVTNCAAEGGTTTGVFTHARTGMSAGTLYYYRGYATNSTGTGYSADGTFTTLAIPTVTSPTVTSITSSGATLGANVTSLGIPASISERGTCWGTSPAPLTNCVAEGNTTTGVFTHARTGMSASTLYYYRGYATNSTGTGYSADDTFTTTTPFITTVADGSAPTNLTVGPGDSVADLDYFTAQTNSGTDTITAVTVTLLPAGAFNNIAQVDLTNSSNLTQCSSVLNPASNTISFSSCAISVTSTGATYKVRVTPKTHGLMPAVPGASYATTGTVTSFTSTNSQSNTDTTSATITIDNLSPNGASAVSGSGGDTNITLNWTSSDSTDFNTTSGSVIYRWLGASAGAEVPTEGSTAVVGAANGTATTACVISSALSTPLSKIDGTGGSTGCTTTALTNGQNYTYKVFQRDTRGNYDAGVSIGTFAPSATPTVTLGTGAEPVATTVAPGSGVADVNYFTLQSNVGSETITSVTVDLSANTGTIDSIAVTNNSNTVLGSLSSPVVGSNTIPVSGMSAGTSITTFKIRVTPFSHASMPAVPGAADAVTAPVTAWAGSLVHAGADTNPNALTIDNLSPGNVTASVTAGDTQVSVNWTNPTDTDFTTGGTVLVLRNTSLVADTPTEGVTYTAGSSVGASVAACVITGTPPATTCTDTGLTNGTPYHYKIFTQDSHGNYSATGVVPSNSPATPTTIVIPTFTISATAGAGGTVLPAGNTSVAQGNSQAYVITPDSGYDIETLLIDGVSIVPASSYTFTNVQAAHTISATFTTSSTVVVVAPGASRPTTVTFTGKAFAGGSVVISKKFLSTEGITGKAVTPGADGSFNISFVGILQGLQSFGLVAKDKNGLVAQTKLFLFDTASSNIIEREILIPPTIDVLYGQVTRGADATVIGYASPNHSVHLYVDDILKGEVRAGGNGFYEFKTSTGALSFGQHKVQVKQTDPVTKKESDLSTTRTFNVSQLTVIKADFSGDGKIDIQDWSIFLSRWLSKDAVVRNSIDLTGDKKVDISDFSIFIKTIRKK